MAKDKYTIEPVDGRDGRDGIDGIDGRTPVKGVDYFTPEEENNFVERVLKRIKIPKIDLKEIADKVVEILKEKDLFNTKDIKTLRDDVNSYRHQLAMKQAGQHGGGTTVSAGTNITLTPLADGTTRIDASGGGGSVTITETEVDFGSAPTTDKTFTVTDAAIDSSKKIMCVESGNAATGRGSGDYLWDTITYAAKAGTGSFTLYAKASGRVRGKRKLYYTYA